MLLRSIGCFSLLLVLSGRAQQPFDLDQSFQTTIGSQNISSLIPLEDGKVLVAGRFDYPGATIQLGVGRLNNDGSWDQSFDANNYMAGKLQLWNGLIYGLNTTVYRLLPNGLLDPEFTTMTNGPYFSPGVGGDYFVYPDGRILMSGSHHLHDSIRGYVGDYNLIWFSNEGYLDTTQHHRACDGHIEYIHPLPDGKFLLGGFWSQYDGIATPNSTHVIRVFPDGALDTTFHCPVSSWAVGQHLLLPNGKHLIAGIFRITGDPDTLQIIRLLPNGALDSTYNYHIQLKKSWGSHPTYTGINCLMPLGTDRLVITGGFDHVAGEPRGAIALLDTAGNLVDDLFTDTECGLWNDGFQDWAHLAGIVPTPDSSSYYIYGSYHGYDDGTVNDAGQRMVSRLYGLEVGVEEGPMEETLRAYPNPTTTEFGIEGMVGQEPIDVMLLDGTGRPVKRWSRAVGSTRFDVRGSSPGCYILVVDRQNGLSQHVKLIIE